MINPTPSAPEIPAMVRNDHFNALDVSRPIFHHNLYNEIKIGKKSCLEIIGPVYTRKAQCTVLFGAEAEKLLVLSPLSLTLITYICKYHTGSEKVQSSPDARTTAAKAKQL